MAIYRAFGNTSTTILSTEILSVDDLCYMVSMLSTGLSNGVLSDSNIFRRVLMRFMYTDTLIILHLKLLIYVCIFLISNISIRFFFLNFSFIVIFILSACEQLHRSVLKTLIN